MTYEMAIGEVLDNDDQKTVRELLFYFELLINNNTMDSFILHNKFSEIKSLNKKEKIKIINLMAKEMLLNSYSLKYLYNELIKFLKQLKETLVEYSHHENLHIYIKLLSEVKDECRATKI